MDIDGLIADLDARGTIVGVDVFTDHIGIWYNNITGTKTELDNIVLQYIGDTYTTLDSTLENITGEGNRYKCRAK